MTPRLSADAILAESRQAFAQFTELSSHLLVAADALRAAAREATGIATELVKEVITDARP